MSFASKPAPSAKEGNVSNSTGIRMGIAAELGLPNEHIGPIQQIGDCLYFAVNGRNYNARLTKTGRLKKNSVRLDLW